MTTVRIACLSLVLWMMFLPGLVCGQSLDGGAVQGGVKDSSGSIVAGAVVTLEPGQRTALTDQAGAFRFSDVAPGNYKITIAARGFAVFTANVAVASGDQATPAISAVLQVAATSNSVDVSLPPHELAAEQMKTEEKQRVLGVFPDFLVSYAPNAAPLTAAQKFHLGWKMIIDPVSLGGTAISAGIDQARNSHPEFGQGTEGYAKRFGTQYASEVSHVLIGHIVIQSIFHQDPRYFYKGTGSFGSRVVYAIEKAFEARGDNGKWQFDYSDVLGGMAAHEISSLYYPATSRPVRRTVDNVLLGFAGRAESNLFHEFILRRLTTHVPKMAARHMQRVIPDGTPVSLVSLEDWSLKTAENGVPVGFMLAQDVRVDGVVVAPIGAQAFGHAKFTGADQTMQVTLDNVQLKIGDAVLPLRSTALKDGGGSLEFHRVEGSGRVSIELYVAGNVTLPPAR